MRLPIDDGLPAPAAPNTAAAPAKRAPVWTRRGTADYTRINLALFLSGYAVFSQLYCTQPLLPVLAHTFGVGAAESSLALSLTTACLAVSILIAGAIQESIDRKWLMFGSLVVAALLEIAVACAPSWHLLLVLRALEGVALGGAPAVAMAHIAEEIEPAGLGTAMGLYIGGNALGGMSGRFVTGVVTELTDWRIALATIGGLGLAAAIGFVVLLPPSRNYVRQPRHGFAHHLAIWRRHLTDPGLVLLFATGFLALGGFVATFNYIGFHLMAPPWGLGHAAVGSIFLVYLFGMVASPIAGSSADRLGRVPVLVAGVALSVFGLLLTLSSSLIAIIAGVAAITAGFFVAHTAASGWIGLMAKADRGHASSIYLLAYYLGSSVAGSLGGLAWSGGGWPGVVVFIAALDLAALLVAWQLHRLTRPARGPAA